MFDSLKGWCSAEITLLHCVGKSGSGDLRYADPITVNGYPETGAVVIIDKYGKEYVSMSRFYFPETVAISLDDKIVQYGKACEIKKISEFFDGNTGLVDMRVAYL